MGPLSIGFVLRPEADSVRRTVSMEMVLFDFSDPRAMAAWFPMNDVVMGGVSTGRLEPTRNGTAAFTGFVSLESGGGFASVRLPLREHDLRDYPGLELRVRGDGLRYKINLRTDFRTDGILYRSVFGAPEGKWHVARIPFDEFLPTLRGRIVSDAPPLDLSHLTSLGLMISDRQAGPFRLEIDRIEAYSG